MGLKPIWIMVAVGGLAIYSATAVFADRDALTLGIAALGFSGAVAVLALSVGNYLLRFWRWDWYLKDGGFRIPVGRHFLYYIAGFALTVTPGKAGEAVRSIYLKPHGVSYPQSLALLFVERLLDFTVILLLAGTFLLGSGEYRALGFVSIILIVSAVVAVGTGHLATLIRAIAPRLPNRLRVLFDHGAEMFDKSRRMLRPSRLGVALIVGLVAWGMEGYGLYILAQALGIDVDVGVAIAIYSTSILAGALAFFLPGGVGGAELVMTALLMHAGAPLGVAVIATIMCRVATLWFAVVLGIAAMVILQRRTQPETI